MLIVNGSIGDVGDGGGGGGGVYNYKLDPAVNVGNGQ